MLSKFLTSAAQPKVESKSPLATPDDRQMYETESERVPTAGQKKKAPAQVAGQQKQSLLQSRLRMTSTQPVGGSLASANDTG